MLIPDLLNTLFDQSDYHALTVLRSLNKRKTNYANKYSLLMYYQKTVRMIELVYTHGCLKIIKQCNNATNCEFAWRSVDYSEAVKYLVSDGVDIHAGNNKMLRLCAHNRDSLKTFKYLVSIGANIHEHDDEIFRSRILDNDIVMIKYLISLGVDIHKTDWRILMLCWDYGHSELATYLLSVGAK